MTELVRRTDATIATSAPPAYDEVRFLTAAFLSGYDNPRTREAYHSDLRQYLTWCAINEIPVLQAQRVHVQAYARALEQAGRAKGSVARKLSAIAGFYGYALAEGVLDRSPCAHIRRPKVSEDSPRLGLDRAELGRMLAIANTHSHVAYALVCLLALNGLRISEVCNATVDDVGAERGHQLLTVTRKGGKRARVVLAPRTAAAVAALPSMTSVPQRDDARAEPEPRAHSSAPAPLIGFDRFAGWRLIRRLAYSAGIHKTISPHSLRHTFVTLSLDAGVPLRDVQDGAGHADPRTTRRYDRGRHSLDRAATYRLTAYLDGNGET